MDLGYYINLDFLGSLVFGGVACVFILQKSLILNLYLCTHTLVEKKDTLSIRLAGVDAPEVLFIFQLKFNKVLKYQK